MEKKILLVDDEDGIRKVLGISLVDLGYEVFAAENGEEALHIFNREHPAVVLTDIKMPVMDGIQLLQHIKQIDPDTEVIMLTGHGDMDLAIKCLKLEATDFITKPINDDVLEIALNRAHEKIFMKQRLRDYTENLEQMVKEKSAQLIEAERRAAVGQAVEGLRTAIRDIAGDLDSGFRFFNELPCYVSIHSRELKVVALNQRYISRFGDRTGQESYALYAGDAAQTRFSPAALTFETGRGQRLKATMTGVDGMTSPVLVHTAPIRNRQDEVELVVEISADIDEVHRLQEQLRASRQLYEQLFDEAPCYITVQDSSYQIVAANRRFKEDFDLEKGARCFAAYRRRADVCPDCPVAKTFADGRSHQCEMAVTAKDGRTHHVLIWTAPIRNVAGKIVQVMEMSTNITQVRELQDQLANLGVIIGSVSHGIKGLLTGLDGGLYLLDRGFEKEDIEKVKEGWDTIKMMVGRIRSMVMDILHYARQPELQWEPVTVRALTDDLTRAVETQIKDLPIEFRYKTDPALETVEIDYVSVRNALMNILENAIEACLDDKRKKKHRIVFTTVQRDDNIVFRIDDDGVGMGREAKEKIFTLFYTSKGDKGTGMGLLLAYKIIRRHGGSITVESENGSGTSFEVSLPRQLSSAIKSIPAPPISSTGTCVPKSR